MEPLADSPDVVSISVDRKRSSSTDIPIIFTDPTSENKTFSEDTTIPIDPKSDQSQDSPNTTIKSIEAAVTSHSIKNGLKSLLAQANSKSTTALHSSVNTSRIKQKPADNSFTKVQPKAEPPKATKSTFSSNEAPREGFLKSGKYSQWLECEKKYNSQTGKMQLMFFCRWCRSTNQDIDFARGAVLSDALLQQSSLQTKAFKEHKDTTQHRTAKEIFLRDSFAVRHHSPTIGKKDDYSEKLYNTISLLLDLLKNNLTLEACIDILKNAANCDLKLSASDISFISLRELVKTMADCLREKIIHEINSSPYFSLILCPWPPNTQGVRSFEVVCYYINQGVPKQAYFDTIVLKETECCGLVAYKRLVNFLKTSNIEYQQKLVGLFTNGDILFNGKNAGVSDLLKKEISDLIAIHPLSYRYFTSSTQNYGLTKAFPIVEHVFQLCIDTFNYFNMSQKQIKGLFENKAEIEELLQTISGSKNPGTKWASILAGVLRIVKTLGKISSALKQSKDFQAKTLEIHYRNPEYIAWMHFLADFTPYLTSYGSIFREKNLTLRGKVKALLEIKKKIMENFLARGSVYVYKEGCWGIFVQNFNIHEGKWMLYDELEMSGGLDIEKCEKDFGRFLEIFIEEIDRRFGNVYDLESLGMFDLAYLKDKSANPANWQGVVDRAKDSVGNFLKRLGKEQFMEPLALELPNLLKYLRENCLGDSKATTLNELFVFCQEKFPISIDLISRYYVLPFNLGDIEKSLRSFGRIQAKIRGSMADDLVRSILMLNLNEEEGEENRALIERFIEEWRRIVFAR